MSEKQKKDDEIVIDFSKAKNWFKKKSKKEDAEHKHHEKKEEHSHQEHKAHHTEHAEHENKEHHTHHEKKEHEHKPQAEAHHKKEDSEEVSFDYKETLNFVKKHAAWLLVLIPILLTIFLRLQPMYLPMTDDWAESTVNNYYKNQVAAQINSQYPNLPDANKNALIDSEFAKLREQNKDIIEQQIAATSQQFKERLMYESGDSKYVYLGDIDSYYWLRDARKFLDHGNMCDEWDYEKGECYIDTYTIAPLKSTTPIKDSGIGKNGKFYAYVIAYVYRILHAFNQDMTIMQASYYVPLIFAIISAILAFLVGKAIAGKLAGLVTSIIISVNPIHLSRTMGSDNDPQNILFPLLIVLFFIYLIKADTLKQRIIYGLLSGIFVSMYAAAWQGWWFMFDFIIGALIVYAGFHIVKEILRHKSLKKALVDKDTKTTGMIFLLIIISSAFFITLLVNFSTFLNAMTSPFWFARTKVAALETFWPNVLVTVAEFNAGSLGTIISQMGGKLLFFLGLLGVLLVLFPSEGKILKKQKYALGIGALISLFLVSKYGIALNPITYMVILAIPIAIVMLTLLKSDQKADVQTAVLLVIWFIATTYAALKGVRFTLLMVPAFAAAFGVTITFIYKKASAWISSELKINAAITKTVVALLLLLVLIAPVKAGYDTATNFMPSVNDAWYNSLTNIRDNSEKDAIINSWWDFGHWFKYLADRRVTLDGSSQGGPPLHWLGKLMVTDDEDMSVGILRMLDCGSNTAFDELNKVLNDTPTSIDILDKIVTLDKKEAGQYLLDKGLTKTEASTVLKYTHCEPPEDFFITSEDMVGKAGVWGHFGSWDFLRAEMFSKVKGTTPEKGITILKDPRYNLTDEEAEQYYYEIQTQDDNQWITTWPGFMSGVNPCQKPNNEGVMICNQLLSNGQQIPIIINLTNMDAYMISNEIIRPESFVYVTPNGTEEKKPEGKILQFSLVLIPTGAEGYSTLITHPYLANSIFTRLFYLEGHGLKHFDKFDDQRGITGGRIIVWKVDWAGENATQAYVRATPEELAEMAEKTTTTAEETTDTQTSEENSEEPPEDQTADLQDAEEQANEQ